MPKGAVCVTRPGKHGNPFTINDVLEERHMFDIHGISFSASQSVRERTVEMFREEMYNRRESVIGIGGVRCLGGGSEECLDSTLTRGCVCPFSVHADRHKT